MSGEPKRISGGWARLQRLKYIIQAFADMAEKVLMSVEEYLHTSFEDADREYVDGEIVEHNMGTLRHGKVQLWLGVLLSRMARTLGIQVASEVRIRVTASRYRIPDLAVWRGGDPIQQDIPETSPFLAIEILSPDDRMISMMEKVQEYLNAGVEFVWIIDPYDGKAMVCTHEHPAPQLTEILRAHNPEIEIALAEVLQPEI